jgi:hypothetical protein
MSIVQTGLRNLTFFLSFVRHVDIENVGKQNSPYDGEVERFAAQRYTAMEIFND